MYVYVNKELELELECIQTIRVVTLRNILDNPLELIILDTFHRAKYQSVYALQWGFHGNVTVVQIIVCPVNYW